MDGFEKLCEAWNKLGATIDEINKALNDIFEAFRSLSFTSAGIYYSKKSHLFRKQKDHLFQKPSACAHRAAVKSLKHQPYTRRNF